MSRFSSFLLGLILGGAAVFLGLKYHVVRADDGLHLIPKTQAAFQDVYIDIRQFGLAEWTEHPALAAAILQADKGELLQDSMRQGLRNSVDQLFDQLKGSGASQPR
jgi:hypothetical protein